MERVGDLEINEDMEFQEREWRWGRLGRALLVVIVLVSGVGLFGHGPISWTTAAADDGSLEVSFERFGRRGGSQKLGLTAPASAAQSGQWQVDLSHDFVGSVSIDSITPQPDSVEAVAGGLRYTFTQADPTAALEASLSLTPDTLWSASGTVGLVGGDAVAVRQFFFP